MDVPSPSQSSPNRSWSFSIREMLLVVAVLGLLFAWWTERSESPAPVKQFDVEGPLVVSYSLRLSPSDTVSGTGNYKGIDFLPTGVVIHSDRGGKFCATESIISLVWDRDTRAEASSNEHADH